MVFTRTIKVEGNGTVKVTKNGTLVGTVTSTNPITITAELGDSYSRTISSGTIVDLCINNVCGSTDYNGGATFNSTHTLTQEFRYIFTQLVNDVILSIELVGNPSNGNMWSVVGTITPTPIMENQHYVKFYVNNILHRTERAPPYCMFGEDPINPALSRLSIDGTYQIRVDAWNTTQTILEDTKMITVIQTSGITFTRTIKVVQGNGTVAVYKNNIQVATVTPTTSYILNANIGDSYMVTATPAIGYIFEKLCTDVPGSVCTNEITSEGTFKSTSIISHSKEFYFTEDCQSSICNFIITQ